MCAENSALLDRGTKQMTRLQKWRYATGSDWMYVCTERILPTRTIWSSVMHILNNNKEYVVEPSNRDNHLWRPQSDGFYVRLFLLYSSAEDLWYYRCLCISSPPLTHDRSLCCKVLIVIQASSHHFPSHTVIGSFLFAYSRLAPKPFRCAHISSGKGYMVPLTCDFFLLKRRRIYWRIARILRIVLIARVTYIGTFGSFLFFNRGLN